MKYRGVKTLEVLEGADNYNAWIAASLSKYIKSPCLEIGAGTGNISSYFLRLKELVLTDNDNFLVNELEKKFKKNKNVHAEVLDIASNLGIVKNHFESIYAINVLEHIKEDDIALINMNKILVKKGKVILLVPAKKFAFTNLDKNLGHYRRYEKEELRKKLENAGFVVQRLVFFNAVGLLSWLIRDKVSREDKQLKKSHVKVFDLLVPMLRLIEPKSHLPLGISLIAVGVKK